MNLFVTNTHEFSEEVRVTSLLVNPEIDLPNQVFVSEFSKFTFINFDDIFSEEFFERLTTFLRYNNEDNLTVFVIDPDPELYFYHHFGKYPLMIIPISCSPQEYVSLMFSDPGESSADAIVYNSSRLVIHSSSLRWAIYGSRDFEVGIFASKDETALDTFKWIYHRTFDVTSVIENILQPAWSPNQFPVDFKKQLLTNYAGR